MKIITQSIIKNRAEESASTENCGSAKAVIICGDDVSVYSNRMLIDDDPTAHAAVVFTRSQRRTIRKDQAFKLLLSKKPCPMCISAIYQANIRNLSYLDNNDDIVHITLNSSVDFRYEEIHTNQEK